MRGFRRSRLRSLSPPPACGRRDPRNLLPGARDAVLASAPAGPRTEHDWFSKPSEGPGSSSRRPRRRHRRPALALLAITRGTWVVRWLDRVAPERYATSEARATVETTTGGCGLLEHFNGTRAGRRFEALTLIAPAGGDSLHRVWQVSEHGAVLLVTADARVRPLRFEWSRDLGDRVLRLRTTYRVHTAQRFTTETELSPDGGHTWQLVGGDDADPQGWGTWPGSKNLASSRGRNRRANSCTSRVGCVSTPPEDPPPRPPRRAPPPPAIGAHATRDANAARHGHAPRSGRAYCICVRCSRRLRTGARRRVRCLTAKITCGGI